MPFVRTNTPDLETQGSLLSPIARGTKNIDSENKSENLEVQNEIAVEETELHVTKPTEPGVGTGGTIQNTAKNKAKNESQMYSILINH